MITLKDIKYNSYIWDLTYFKALKNFLGAFKADVDEIVWSNELMYKEWTDLDSLDKKVLDRTLANEYWHKYLFKVDFEVDWLLAEFYWTKNTSMMLPKLLKSSNVTEIKSKVILILYKRIS